MLKRWLFLIITVTLVVSCASWFAFLLEPNTLAKESMTVGDATFVFRIINDDGQLTATVTEGKMRGTTRIGTADEIGLADPWIVVDEKTQRVNLHVGKASLGFDPETRSFYLN